MSRVYKIMSQNGDRKSPKCEKRFKNWSMASYELGQKAKSWSFFKKEDMKTSYMEIDDKHFELMHDGKKPRMLARVEYTHDGYQFRYWIEIVES